MTKLTIKEWCEKSGVSPDALRMAFPKIGLSNFAQSRELSPAEISMLDEFPFRRRKEKSVVVTSAIPKEKPRTVSEAVRPLSAKDQRQPILPRLKNWTIGGLLVSGVISHAFLVWYDCAQLWGTPGFIGGLGMFLIAVAAVLLASDPDKFGTSGDALVFIFFVDAAAYFVHYEVFKAPVVSNLITGALCGFICGASFFALYLYRQFKFSE